ncbi:protease modulator HflC [candidate division KSB1 bacterium]|nr:protease modulator HflC [candidate division KSB1 bacterium]RQW03311.1 MAG: protease modulator HflC [candidate division KSB1 bacterium]
MRNPKLPFLVVLIFIGVILISQTLYTVDETEQVIITMFGEPRGEPIQNAGLHLKLPFIHKAIFFEKRIMEWDGNQNEIPTSDKRYLLVDTFARWRIIDPLKYFQSVNNEDKAQSRLDDLIDGITRDYISKNLLIEVVRSSNREMEISTEGETSTTAAADSLKIRLGRLAITDAILAEVQKIVPQYGIEMMDIRIKQVNYNHDVREKVFDRMISERQRIAQLYRSEGMGRKAQIEGKMQKELNQIESEAYRAAQQITGKADAEATQIYAEAFSRDPEFYSLLRTLESYRQTIDTSSTLILSTDSEYLKYLKRGR